MHELQNVRETIQNTAERSFRSSLANRKVARPVCVSHSRKQEVPQATTGPSAQQVKTCSACSRRTRSTASTTAGVPLLGLGRRRAKSKPKKFCADRGTLPVPCRYACWGGTDQTLFTVSRKKRARADAPRCQCTKRERNCRY